ncbi:ABC transporter, permease protein [gut metagenome]|uniref:ABC transporter, permease protein n=1 Tax=gut metagenome TaxID=749906 RepID=J9FA63_9ZZZZ
MNKTFLIIQREFLNRVSKKSFILLTLLMPFIFAALIFVPLMLSMVKSDEAKQVVVIDHTTKYIGQFKDNESYHFIPGIEMRDEYRSDSSAVDAVVEITADLIEHPDAATIYSRKEITRSLSALVNQALNEQIRHDKLANYNIPALQDIMRDFDQSYTARTVKWSEDGTASESNTGIAIAAGMILTFLIYMFVMSYGGMVMQSVMEEKTNRIVELMISSVKPMQLMMGKIIGIGLVGIVQLAIWGVMLFAILGILGSSFGLTPPAQETTLMTGSVPPPVVESDGILAAIQHLDFVKLGILFVLNFIGGYLIYASIFAAIAASINAQEDSQQFMMPIVILIIFALYAGIYSGDNPDGPLAFWCSMIPFTSPIVMMVRIPLDVPTWQIFLSLGILYASAFTFIWISGKIYRVGILMYGKKPSLTEMIKWISYK